MTLRCRSYTLLSYCSYIHYISLFLLSHAPAPLHLHRHRPRLLVLLLYQTGIADLRPALLLRLLIVFISCLTILKLLP